MHVTLHLTTDCLLNCTYCYSPPFKSGNDMSLEVIDKSIEFATKECGSNIGLIFFGGEPLLRKDLMEYAVLQSKKLEYENEGKFFFHYKVTTNGLLLDDEFLNFSRQFGINLGLSIDGNAKAHDTHRKFRDGRGSFSEIEARIPSILEANPYTNAFMVVTPENVSYYAESVEYLIEKGFRYIIPSLNYAAEWTDNDLKELKKQYIAIAKLYKKWTLEQKKFYFSPFEMKFASHIRENDDVCYTCELSKKQVSIAPDGKIYPCVQFVKDGISNTEFSIGDVWNGFNEKREMLFEKSIQQKIVCEECALKKRCYNTCSCLNWQTTGSINEVCALLCETERMVIPIVDKLGQELFKKRAAMFIQKQYNKSYLFLSMLEDQS